MTRAEALKAQEKKTPVIYTGPGSMGRGGWQYGASKEPVYFRGSLTSIGIITKVKQTKAVVRSYGPSGSIHHIKHLHKANPAELKAAREHNKKWYPNLKFNY